MDKIKNLAENTMKINATMVVLNRQELEIEREVFLKIEGLIKKLKPDFEKKEELFQLHPDEELIVSQYNKAEGQLKTLYIARELSEEAIKQFEINLENLGEES